MRGLGVFVSTALLLLIAAKCLVVFQAGFLADEAYYWLWSLNLAWGYFDQPPVIAWIIRAASVVSQSEWALRTPMLLAGFFAPLVLRWGGMGELKWLHAWWLCLPALFWLTAFATPDALLLFFWTAGLACGFRGGRWWLAAGLFAGLATLSKYSGFALYPCLLLACNREERSQIWPWIGAAIFGLLGLPNIAWNIGNGWIAVTFQASEGFSGGQYGPLGGTFRYTAEQFLLLNPILAVAGCIWAVKVRPLKASDRLTRFSWWTSVPLFLFFGVAALWGDAEAHWPAIGLVGLGTGLLSFSSTSRQWVGYGLALGWAVQIGFSLHLLVPWIPFSADPGARFTEGRVLGKWAGKLARKYPDTPIVTERYQEAALIQYYGDVPAYRMLDCGRDDQFSIWGKEFASDILYVRPSTGGQPTCFEKPFTVEGDMLDFQPLDPWRRPLGPWQALYIRGNP
jgi:4-amino-4-deoxy-L-arabinose transferase-like glycosyltransferase